MREKAWKTLAMITGAMLLILMIASYAPAQSPRGDLVVQRGGTLRISYRGECPIYNLMINTDLPLNTFASPVYNGLVMIDPTQEEVNIDKVVPSLAERWEISPNGKIYTFYLRKGVKFHDGHPFTAVDAKYSLDFYRDPSKAAFAPLVSMIDRVEIIDDYTVRVYLEYPFKNFLLYITYPYCVMLPAHLADVNPKSTDFLVGTGPFIFKERIPGKVYKYERNPNYFISGLPYLDALEIYIIPWGPHIDAFIAGRLDMCGGLRYGAEMGGGKQGVDKIKKYVPDAIIKLEEVPVIRSIVMNVTGIHGHKGPWQDVRVRRAMAMLIDYPGNIMAAYGSLDFANNTGIVPGFVPTALSWKELSKVMGIDKPWEERVAEAKRLMKEAGYPNGFKATLNCKDIADYWKGAELITRAWKDNLNIETSIQILKNPVYYPKRDAADFDMIYDGARVSFGGAPEETLSLFVSDSLMNYAKWSNPDYDRLYNELLRETDNRRREEISGKIQRLFHTELPSIPILNNCPGVAYRPTLHGHVIQPSMTNSACLDRIWKEK